MQLFKRVTLGLVLTSVAALATAEERKIVYDLKTGDPDEIVFALFDDIKRNTEHYAERGIDFKAAVVISGQAYKFFVEDIAHSPFKDDAALPAIQAKFRPILEELVNDYGVEFNMCIVGMQRRNLTADVLYPFVDATKSQPVYLADYQAEGYAYLPLD